MELRTALGWFLVLATTPGCAAMNIYGPLEYERYDRDRMVNRSRAVGVSEVMLDAIYPPIKPEELELMNAQTESCRLQFRWKNALSWIGGGLVGIGAGGTIIGAYATGQDDQTGKIIFGISAGTFAAIGTILSVAGGVVQQHFSDSGCVMRDLKRLPSSSAPAVPPSP